MHIVTNIDRLTLARRLHPHPLILEPQGIDVESQTGEVWIDRVPHREDLRTVMAVDTSIDMRAVFEDDARFGLIIPHPLLQGFEQQLVFGR